MERVDIKVGFYCNNQCLFCVQGRKRDKLPAKSVAEVEASLREARAAGKTEVVLTGGEPCMHPQFLQLVRIARDLGFSEIQIQTNGRMFAYLDFCIKVIEAGATQFSPALHGSTADIHDFLTDAPRSYEQTVAGIRNLKKLGQYVLTNTVITSKNYQDLPNIARLLVELGVDQFQFAFVHILGTADKNKEWLVPRKSAIAPFVREGLLIGKAAGKKVTAEAIPYCQMTGVEDCVAEEIMPKTRIYDAGFMVDDYGEYRLSRGKLKGEACASCRYNEICEGPWKEYVELFGFDEFVPVKKINLKKIFINQNKFMSPANLIKTLLITTGYTCNNKCLMCSVEEKRCAFPDREMNDIELDLKDGRLKDFTEIEFTGGEPTARRDLLDLVARAKALGYERISLSTNGRMFSYDDYCQKIIAAGLNKATISLLGPNEKIHNAITRTPESFKETMAGIKKLKKISEFQVNISTVVSSLNYEHLQEIAELVSSLGIKNWYLLDLIPEGAAQENYMRLAVTQKELSRVLNQLNSNLDNFQELGFFDFPFCLFAPEMINNPKINFINTQKRGEMTEQVGFNPERIIKDERGLYSDELRQQIGVCTECRFKEKCGGVWKEYLDKFGEDETVELMKKNGCGINN